MERWLRLRFPNARWEAPEDALGVVSHRVRFAGNGVPLPGNHLFVDLETLGFVGRPLFLVGVLFRVGPKEADLIQLLARDYAEEEDTIRYFQRRFSSFPAWVTFNGKSFDLPCLRLRCAYYRLPQIQPARHLDLLHLARRHFRGVFADCRLKTLEHRLCGRVRSDDLDGGLVPYAYHRYVRECDPAWLEPILRHNRDDLITLAELYRVLAELEGEACKEGV